VSHGYGAIYSTVRKEIQAAILARLEDKSDHNYQWPRWAAADEASYAVMEWLEAEGLA
jgi:hypothetical protein